MPHPDYVSRLLQKVTTLTPAPDTDTPTHIVILRRPAPGVPQEQTGYTQLLGGGKEYINGIPKAFLLSSVADPDFSPWIRDPGRVFSGSRIQNPYF